VRRSLRRGGGAPPQVHRQDHRTGGAHRGPPRQDQQPGEAKDASPVRGGGPHHRPGEGQHHRQGAAEARRAAGADQHRPEDQTGGDRQLVRADPEGPPQQATGVAEDRVRAGQDPRGQGPQLARENKKLADDLSDAKNTITELTRRMHELELELRRLENERDELTAAYREAEAVSWRELGRRELTVWF
jgi:hypothetical protein